MPSKTEELIGSNGLAGVVISPEGAEEKLIRETIFRITLTQGGLYRLYSIHTDEDGEPKTQPISLHKSLPDAKKHIAQAMTMIGSLELDPRGTIDALLASIRKA